MIKRGQNIGGFSRTPFLPNIRVANNPPGPSLVAFRNQVAISARSAERERAGRILLSQPPRLSMTSPPSDTGGKPTLLLQPHKPGSGSAEAQLLLNHLASIVAQNPPGDHGW